MKSLFRSLALTLFVTTLAGCGGGGGGSTPPVSSAILGLALGYDENQLYIANVNSHIIQKLNLTTLAVTTFAGSPGVAGTATGTGTDARFYAPFGLVNVPDGSNNDVLYVADTYNQTVRKITSAKVVSNLAGTMGGVGDNDATGSSASFAYPKGIAFDGTSLYTADNYSQLIRTVTTAGVVTTLAGSSFDSGYVDGATNAGIKFRNPFGLAATSTYVYVTDAGNNSVRSIKLSDKSVSTLAGSTSGSSGSTDATGTAARFNNPAGIATDGTNLYVTDADSHTIRKIVISSGVVTTIAGTAGSSGSTDGQGSTARFNVPIALAINRAGTLLYVSDQLYTKVRKIDLTTSPVTVTTLNATF